MKNPTTGIAINLTELTLHIKEVQTMQPEITPPFAYDAPMVLVEYVEGFTKWHSASDVVQLIGKISNTLRSKYGVTSFEIESAPKELEAGDIILKGLTYGS